MNDNTYVWAKPWDWMEIRAGNWFGDAIKSSQSYGIRNSKRIGLGGHEITTFARICDNKKSYDDPMRGALLGLTPIDSLFVGVGFDIGNGAERNIANVMNNSQYAVGYTIDGLLAIKAHYMRNATE